MTERGNLTRRQQEVYNFIRNKIRQRGYGPTVREIAAQFEIKSPNGVVCHLNALVKKNLISREPNMSRAISLIDKGYSAASIPMAGYIAAGSPLEAPEQAESVDFAEMFSKPGYFALQVRGQSMIEDHIDEGDYVVVKRQTTARDGQIVVALVGPDETTLKRYFKEANRFRLEPANSSMKPIYAKNVEILGVVVGVVRRFHALGL